MKKKTLEINMIINALKNVLSVLFPLITFPYITKVLDVEGIGSFSFSSSVIDFFCVFAMLGVSSYATREGAMIRDDRVKLQRFGSQMFTINVLSMVISYVLFLLVLLLVPKFSAYHAILIVLSSRIIFSPMTLEWLFSIEEDYLYITIRSIALQIISLVLMFAFVKTRDDVVLYAFITAFSQISVWLWGYFRSKKYVRIGLVLELELKKHLKPILTLFSMTIATTIYVSSDMIVLGFMTDDYHVGIYTAAVKVYKIARTTLGAILVVAIPRLSYYLGNNDKKNYDLTADKVLGILLTFLLPVVTGMFIMAKDIIGVISNERYENAQVTLRILCGALFFCMLAWYYGQCILLPLKQEKVVLVATIISAGVNVILNFILIPIWKENAAALTTLVSEMLAMIICMWKSYRGMHERNCFTIGFKSFFGCVIMSFTIIFLNNVLKTGEITRFVISALSAFIIYCVVELVLGNNVFVDGLKMIRKYVTVAKH